jgi:hypothetical protein
VTELNRALVENVEFNKWICGRTPAGRWGKPEELAGAAVFLASPASDFVNGQILYVDGGLLAALWRSAGVSARQNPIASPPRARGSPRASRNLPSKTPSLGKSTNPKPQSLTPVS